MNLRNDFEALGINAGDMVLMHSSFKSVGTVEGGIGTLIGALTDVLTERGTLIVPTLSFSYVTEANPVFDVRKTRSCIGAIPEYVRQMPGVYRSLSPTHSAAALGRLARDVTAGQLKDDTPIGQHSPFRRLAEAGGKLLFLGCGARPNTMMHGVEEVVDAPYLFKSDYYPFTVIDEKGMCHDIQCRRHNFAQDNLIYNQRYERVIDLLDESEKRFGKIGQADCWLLDAGAAWRKAEAALRRDPLALVEITEG